MPSPEISNSIPPSASLASGDSSWTRSRIAHLRLAALEKGLPMPRVDHLNWWLRWSRFRGAVQVWNLEWKVKA